MRVAGGFSDSERVSTGTKFALEEWLACQRHWNGKICIPMSVHAFHI